MHITVKGADVQSKSGGGGGGGCFMITTSSDGAVDQLPFLALLGIGFMVAARFSRFFAGRYLLHKVTDRRQSRGLSMDTNRCLSIVRSIVVLSIVILLSSCGGGGGGGGGSATPESNDDDSITSTIGTSGGSLTTPSGDAKLDVPAGTLSSDTPITIALSSSNQLPTGNLTGIYEFSSNVTTFNSPVTITLKYDSASLPDGIDTAWFDIVLFIKHW